MARIMPEPTPETRHFWDGCRDGELRLQRCTDCNHTYFPPRAFCPSCASRQVEVYAASGRGVLWSYVINHRPRPDMGTEPYAIAVVKLDEGPTMMTNIVGCQQTPEALVLDMPVKVRFEKQTDDISLPLFEPAQS
ncbi:MAG: Zn-ribbon domain-containing OB-fold protein [Phenylobacterium sp.]